MKVLYFSDIRHKVGVAEETISLPVHVRNVAQLIAHLCDRDPKYKAALTNPKTLKIAVNHQYSDSSQSITDKDEIAFFPPVTGG